MANTLITHTEIDDDGQIVVTLIGELDDSSVGRARSALATLPRTPDRIDLRFVSFVSAAGVALVLEVAAGVRGPQVVTSSAVERVIDLSGAATSLDLARSAPGSPALDHAEFAVGVHDGELRYLYVNRALERLNGLDAASHLGQRPHDLFDIDHDDLSPVIADVLQHHRPHNIVVSADTPGGSPGTLGCSYLPARYRDNGRIIDAAVAVVAVATPLASSRVGGRLIRFDVRRPADAGG